MTHLFAEPSSALIPLTYLVGALGAVGSGARRAWAAASVTAGLVLAGALLLTARIPFDWTAPKSGLEAAGRVVMLLIAFLGWIIVRFSRQYLEGEPRQVRYVGALLSTLAGASTVVLSGNLLLLILAWTATSVSVQTLLTFYSDRRAALLAAHKKFFVSRVGDLLLLGMLVFLWSEVGSFAIPDLFAHLERSQMTVTMHVAAVLLALALVVKSAQLPVHGWLMQVMEAPTPVSALLHAGVVNIGGVVAIRLAPLLGAAPLAQAVLVLFGTVTAVLAGLVMMTRISVKVRLAWSTCAQMGFMLMECGLGLFDLALLHIVSHSLYKAYAFLAAGEAVLAAKRRRLYAGVPHAVEHCSLRARFAAVPAAAGIVWLSSIVWRSVFPAADPSLMSIFLIAITIAPLLWAFELRVRRTAMHAFAIVQLSLGWHLVFATLLQTQSFSSPPVGLAVLVVSSLLGLYAAQCFLTACPSSQLARRIYRSAFAGFTLDERFTRLTIRWWPLRVPIEKSATDEASSVCHILAGEQQ